MRWLAAAGAVLAVAFVVPFITTDLWLPSADQLGDTLTRRFDLLGAESFAEDGSGFIYTGLADGRVVRLHPETGAVEDIVRLGEDDNSCGSDVSFQSKCGRPLGMAINPLNPTSQLIVCDGSSSQRSLMLIDFIQKTKRTLITEVDGLPIIFCNSLDVTPNGVVIFTHSSDTYPVKDFVLEIVRGKPSGRLLMYNLRTGEARTLVKDLFFPNGVTLAADGMSVFYAELGERKLFQLRSPEVNEDVENALWNSTMESVLFKILPVYPDNLTINPYNGNLLVGTASKLKPLAAVLRAIGAGPALTRIPVKYLTKAFPMKPAESKVLEIETLSAKLVRIYHDPKGRLGFLAEGFIPRAKSTTFSGMMLLGTFAIDYPAIVAPII